MAKITIIGGGGLVGSSAAFALQCFGLGRVLALVDVNRDVAEGHMLDLLHGGPSSSDQCIVAGGYEHIPDSRIICITAGLRRQPGESRLDLINRNTELFVDILNQVEAAGPHPDAIVLVVSNPVDVLTYVAARRLTLPESQIIGLGTQLDSIRFRSLIARELDLAPTEVSALILGEHGETMVPIWSSATAGSLPLAEFPGFNASAQQRLLEQTRGSGAEVISKKGGAGFAVGMAIKDVVQAILTDSRRTLPVSSVQRGVCYGIRDVALSVPTVLGNSGVARHVPVELWPKEVQGIRRSEANLRQTIAKLPGV